MFQQKPKSWRLREFSESSQSPLFYTHFVLAWLSLPWSPLFATTEMFSESVSQSLRPQCSRRAYVVINQLIVSVVPAGRDGTRVPRCVWRSVPLTVQSAPASLYTPVLAILLTSVESGPWWSNNVWPTQQHRQVLRNTKLTSRYEKVMNYCEVEQSYEQTQAGSGSQEDWWGRGNRGDQERRRSRARWGQSLLLST